MLRNVFLTLSQSEPLRRVATGFPPARKVSRRFVAGEQLKDALDVLKELQREGLLATMDFLGENTTSRAEAAFYTDEIIRSIEGMAAAGLEPHVSLKLTAMGLDISDDLAKQNLRRVIEAAHPHPHSFVNIDMESSDYIDRTLAIYWQMRAEGFDKTGAVIQSYLYRSEKDVLALIDGGAAVRLVKGAYDEPPHLAYPEKADVDANFIHLMKLLLGEEARAKGVYTALATHDPKMVEAAKQYTTAHDVPRDTFEFQMLYGIATGTHHTLAAEGYRFRVYVPYGTHWYPYFMRRLAERPANILFVLRNLLRG